ncbi:MAG: P-loop NTPase [Xenococcus sp. (in: cyanobacteria)]
MINQVTSKRKVISIVSAKGGAGKSLLTAVVGCALARQDMQVLIVDCDIIVPEFKILFDQYCNNLEPRQKTLTFSDFLKPNNDKYLNESQVTIE